VSLLPALDGEFTDRADSVEVSGEASSWEDLVGRADELARSIAGATAIGLSATASLDTVIGVVAGLRAGVPVVPIAADSGPTERAHILDDADVSIVLGQPDWPEVGLTRVAIPTARHSGSWAKRREGVPALVMYTSGTTGPPKGAAVSASAIAAGLDGLADAWQWSADDTLVHGLPLFHVHGLILGILGALRTGSRVRHTGKPTPESYAAAGGSMYFGVPTVWSRVVSQPESARALASARLLVSGSAALPVPVFDQLVSLTGQAPIERYGMTETLITLSTRADGERRRGHVGMPIRGVETRMRGDAGEPVEHDGVTIGGLQVRGDTLFDRYLNLPDKTSETYTEDGWLITGDAATIDSGGFHRIVGRASIDIIKCGGFKIGAGEVESALLMHPTVSEVAVIGVPDDDLGERIVGFVVGDQPRPADLIDFVADQLSTHKRPREIRVVDSLPRNAMGKVQKQRLREE
jgi:fatty acid CoA ligase FadD36